jgi:hypothetical protein
LISASAIKRLWRVALTLTRPTKSGSRFDKRQRHQTTVAISFTGPTNYRLTDWLLPEYLITPIYLLCKQIDLNHVPLLSDVIVLKGYYHSLNI